MTVQLCGWDLETELLGKTLLVRLPGARKLLNVAHLRTLAEELERLFASSDCEQLVLDFAAVDFLHSDALNQFVALQKRLQQNNGSLALWNVDRHLFTALEATQLDEFLNARMDSPLEAVQS